MPDAESAKAPGGSRRDKRPNGRPAGRPEVKTYATAYKPTWCPGCGDFGILAALKAALVDLEIWPHEVLIVSGIGCGSKLPQYIHANGFMTIHGRPLAVATGAKLANPELHVIVVNGDGDGYGIGGNHFLHTCRRNPDITHIVENNQIYALTKGQYSPTSDPGFRTTTSPDGVFELPVNPVAVALAAGATFIARSFAGEPKHLQRIIAQAVRHPGYALVDVLQPCIAFNKVNTYNWYAERVYDVAADDTYDPTSLRDAWERGTEWGDRIPIGILYRKEGVPPYETRVAALRDGAPVHRDLRARLDPALFQRLHREFV
ncbi:MAG: 2-oxoacid:ferredoxin oxidoreductase subunit beta [Firmicutes bacterium]|nr:2-oxoacid:ferredoxin oxidoreductase subunit beta [Bacillota bacterium]